MVAGRVYIWVNSVPAGRASHLASGCAKCAYCIKSGSAQVVSLTALTGFPCVWPGAATRSARPTLPNFAERTIANVQRSSPTACDAATTDIAQLRELLGLPALTLPVRLRDEVYKCDCRSYGKTRVPRLEATMISISTMTGAIQTTKLR